MNSCMASSPKFDTQSDYEIYNNAHSFRALTSEPKMSKNKYNGFNDFAFQAETVDCGLRSNSVKNLNSHLPYN